MIVMTDIEKWLLPGTHVHIKKIQAGRPLNLTTMSFTSFTLGPDWVLYKIMLLKYINLKL